MLTWFGPGILPIHGEYRQLFRHAELARSLNAVGGWCRLKP
jgi:mRNA degradation ribonuclease J1/J2